MRHSSLLASVLLPGFLCFGAVRAQETTTLEQRFDANLSSRDQRDWMKQMAAEPNQVGSPNDKANAPRRPKPQRFPRTRISPPKTVYFRPRKLYNTQDDLGLRMPNSDELLSLAGFGWRENHISALFSGSAGRDQWGIDVPEVAVAL